MRGLVFPGQGSQHIGMGKFLYENFNSTKNIFEEASDALHQDLKKLCFEGPESDLQLTKNTQPALLLVSVASFKVLQESVEIKPAMTSGHSVGEYAALVTANAISFSDAVKAVRTRGEAMQEAVPVGMGGMCAVMGLSDEAVVHLCQWVEKTSNLKPLEPANFNAPGQVVISGNQKAIEWLQANYKTEDCFKGHAELANIKRVKFIALKVSAPFHCSMMNPAEEKMRRVLEDCKFQNAKWSIVQNKSAELVTDANILRENVIRQISSPVLWTQCVKKFMDAQVEKVIECGSGRVLSGLLGKITDDKIKCLNLNSLEDLKLIEAEF